MNRKLDPFRQERLGKRLIEGANRLKFDIIRSNDGGVFAEFSIGGSLEFTSNGEALEFSRALLGELCRPGKSPHDDDDFELGV